MMEDGGSGRTEIWQTVWRKFASSPFSEKLFGHGFHAVAYKVMPLGYSRFAHNSWLEILYDYGMVGLGLIVILVLYFIVKTVKMIREKSAMSPVMGYTIVGMLVMATVSYFFEQSVIILPFCMVWGICVGSHYRNHHFELRGE
jgi:O-antigen ligase